MRLPGNIKSPKPPRMAAGEHHPGKVTTMKKTKETIRKYIVENFLFGEDEGLTDDTSLLEKRIVDSTGILELVAFLEREFSIRIKDEELIPENLDSIDNMHHYLQTKRPPLADSCTTGSWVAV